jgi:hypothetical protein
MQDQRRAMSLRQGVKVFLLFFTFSSAGSGILLKSRTRAIFQSAVSSLSKIKQA